MALSERIEEDQIEIVGQYRQLQVRVATIIEKDGVEVSRTFSRRVLPPDADVASESQLVRGVSNVAWTPEVKNAWKLARAANRDNTIP